MLRSRTTNAVSHTNVHLCTSWCRIFSGFDRLGCKGWAQVQTESVVGLFNKVNAFFWANYRNLKSERLLLFCSECVWKHIHLLFRTSTINMLGQQKMPDAVWCQQADQFRSAMACRHEHQIKSHTFMLIPVLWWMKLSCIGTLIGNENVFIYYVQKQSNK